MENKELASGTTLQSGKYTIERVLGAGGFGITYYARHNTLGNHVAIKEFFISGYCIRNTVRKSVSLQGIDSAVYDKYLQKFIEEAQILAQLDQPNIVKVIDIFQENNTAYIVMPFVEGQTLQQSVEQKGRLDYETAVNYIAQLSEAVDYIHQRNILHRDIKPDNVIITPENKAILIDFGSAREFIQDKTQNLTSIYTQGYAPLEQYSANSRKGSYSDIYSLGATFYFALTGQKPMDATTRMMETMPEPKALIPSIPDEANRTIMKAMSLKPEDRQQRIDEFMGDLLNVETPKTNKIKPVITTNIVTAKHKNKNVLLIIMAIIAIVLIGAGGYYGIKQWQYYQQELSDYNNVISANNITDCDNYLNIYPEGKHQTEVKNLRNQLQQKQEQEEQARIAQEHERQRIAQEDEQRRQQEVQERITQQEEQNQQQGSNNSSDVFNSDKNNLQVKKIVFSDNNSYYVTTSGNDILRRTIEQNRINMMKQFFNNFVSDSPEGWNAAKRNIEAKNVTNCDRGSSFSLQANHYYQNNDVISFVYEHWTDICYAHPDYGKVSLTFDKNSGNLININNLILDRQSLMRLAEKYFRAKNNIFPISPQANINDKDIFMFENDKFRLPNNPTNFEFTNKGLKFFYDDVEVSSHAAGPPEFTIPYSELKGIIDYVN